MKKINLKSILKKTFKKKIKKNKNKKTLIKVKKIKFKKKTKRSTKPTKTIKEKTNLLRISKQNEQKPEIKKIKKQDSAKREYKIKDYVVYPKHGVGIIKEFKKTRIGEIDVDCYIIDIEREKLILQFPVNKQHLLRPLSTINQVNKSISILKSKPKIKRSMWSRRAQEYDQKITSGKIYELAEVVRDLNKGDDLMVEQSYSERQLFEKAYERILTEFQIVLKVSTEDTQKKLNKALKRNLENQTKYTEQKPVVNPENQINQEVTERAE